MRKEGSEGTGAFRYTHRHWKPQAWEVNLQAKPDEILHWYYSKGTRDMRSPGELKIMLDSHEGRNWSGALTSDTTLSIGMGVISVSDQVVVGKTHEGQCFYAVLIFRPGDRGLTLQVMAAHLHHTRLMGEISKRSPEEDRDEEEINIERQLEEDMHEPVPEPHENARLYMAATAKKKHHHGHDKHHGDKHHHGHADKHHHHHHHGQEKYDTAGDVDTRGLIAVHIRGISEQRRDLRARYSATLTCPRRYEKEKKLVYTTSQVFDAVSDLGGAEQLFKHMFVGNHDLHETAVVGEYTVTAAQPKDGGSEEGTVACAFTRKETSTELLDGRQIVGLSTGYGYARIYSQGGELSPIHYSGNVLPPEICIMSLPINISVQ